jgi:ribonuclease HI
MSEIVVFCDGAAKGNPGPGGWGAVIVTPDERVTELGGGAPHTTNNRMELTGAIAALAHVAGNPAPVAIYTDSSYVIKGITQWVWNWQRRGWRTAEGHEVLNRDLWEQLSALVNARGRDRIAWHWVRGHVGTPGNERVDQIAVAFSNQRTAQLFAGPLSNYGPRILELPEDTSLPARSQVKSAGKPAGGSRPPVKGRAFSYLSVVDGVLERHATWAECERRVKGRSGARFKKAHDAADEASILRGWGVSE